MEQKIKLKIGEFSKRNQVSVKTLRFYEQIGLLIPFEIDDWTGYRYYDVSQMKTMTNIFFLKKLGFRLEEIKEMLNNNCATPTLEMVEEKLKICRDNIKLLACREAELKNLQQQLTNKTAMEDFVIKTLPHIIVASHRQVLDSYADLFNLCPNVIAPEMERLGCKCSEPGYCFTIDHNKEYREKNVDVEYCEAVTEKKTDSDLIQFKELEEVKTALCFNHYGAYEKFHLSWAKIYAYLEKNAYQIVDNPRFCYIDGIWNKENPNEWLTEIQVPIKK